MVEKQTLVYVVWNLAEGDFMIEGNKRRKERHGLQKRASVGIIYIRVQEIMPDWMACWMYH